MRPLDDHVRSRIRSMFVVFDPCQAIVELVSNSLDAGSSRIEIILDFGRCSFEVKDNGSGIDEENLKLIPKRYVTSKCHSLEELGHVSTLGWRGEALASLATVSTMQIVSRTQKQPWPLQKMIVHGGNPNTSEGRSHVSRHCEHRKCGTTVTVRDLFAPFPVRKKMAFANPIKEAGKVQKAIERIALIHPSVTFSLLDLHKRAMMLQVKSVPNIAGRFGQLFSRRLAADLHPLTHRLCNNGFEILLNGLISAPSTGFPSRDLQVSTVAGDIHLSTEPPSVCPNEANTAFLIEIGLRLSTLNEF